MNKIEKVIIQRLDEILKNDYVRKKLDEIVKRVEEKLEKPPSSVLSWEPVPVEIYRENLPGGIKSSWVFVMSAGMNTGPERHPNSHQRMMSYRGSGNFPVFVNNRWHSNFLTDNPCGRLEERWVSIPKNTWHYGIVSEKNWAVVSFHTVPADELIEERPESSDLSLIKSRLYTKKNS